VKQLAALPRTELSQEKPFHLVGGYRLKVVTWRKPFSLLHGSLAGLSSHTTLGAKSLIIRLLELDRILTPL
jgi:hypothetical protein